MKSKLILCLALVLSGISFGQPFSIPPMPSSSDLPGENAVKMRTYWLAPYVRASEGFGGTKVTWFDKDGQIKRQADVRSIEPGFVITGPGETILGVNEDWKITLPPEPTIADSRHSMSGYITSTPDSRVFVHEYHPKGGMVAEDIYVHGKLVNTIGPFVEHLGDEITLNDDGSASLLIWRNELKTNVETVTLDANGHIVKPETARSHPLPELGPNPICVGRIPGTHQSLFWTSIGFEDRYHLVNEDTGKQLWNIPCPGGGERLAEGLTPKFIIFAVAELYAPGPWRGSEWVFLNSKKDWIRAFYAVNVQNGQIVARWQERYPRRYCDSDYGHFLWMANSLYYVTPDEFTKINFQDIASKDHGWK
jgi:outer membrane protein assembly factor BamB